MDSLDPPDAAPTARGSAPAERAFKRYRMENGAQGGCRKARRPFLTGNSHECLPNRDYCVALERLYFVNITVHSENPHHICGKWLKRLAHRTWRPCNRFNLA